MKNANVIYGLLMCGSLLLSACGASQTAASSGSDSIAENMLVYQRNTGGWPKHVNDARVDYSKKLTEAEKAAIIDDQYRNDATIDNQATTKEIRHLVKAFKTTGNKKYLAAAEKGIRYLLQMQKDNGGFPQFYPDSSSYRGQITYNDNAMINALNVLWDVTNKSNGFEVVGSKFIDPARRAVERGITCILATQITLNGKLTGWCAQHDKKTFAPVKARIYELPSISGMETVGIVEFLMKIEKPSEKIKAAITAATKWLEAAKIRGYKYIDVKDDTQPNGRDRILVKDDVSTVWARFYDLETGRPFFAGRNGEKKWELTEIEVERRTGYAWYGTWPEKLLQKSYPAWLSKNGLITSKTFIVVSKEGRGDYTSIQQAIDHLPDTSVTPRTIHIQPGVYNEKIFITKHNIILEGEDRETTKIVQSIARDEWRCDHKDDWGVATMNLDGDDITLLNLTIINDYGYTNKESRTVKCASDSTGKKVITKDGHQMALRSMNTTRLKAINCRFSAWAGDTVSPWNLVDGMFYFRDCIMEGGVDFYCPRGYAYAENCTFFANTGPAAIWHDGSGKEDYKTVLKNCRFDGYKGFRLGRFHRDAQFFLVDCSFSGNMADQDIYLVPTSNVIQWGRRVYYSNCHREGGDFAWHGDNISMAAGVPTAASINAEFVFRGKWKP